MIRRMTKPPLLQQYSPNVVLKFFIRNKTAELYKYLYKFLRLYLPNSPAYWPVVHSYLSQLFCWYYFIFGDWRNVFFFSNRFLHTRAPTCHGVDPIYSWDLAVQLAWVIDSVNLHLYRTVLLLQFFERQCVWWKAQSRDLNCVFSVIPLTFWTWNQAHLTHK